MEEDEPIQARRCYVTTLLWFNPTRFIFSLESTVHPSDYPKQLSMCDNSAFQAEEGATILQLLDHMALLDGVARKREPWKLLTL